MIPAETDRQEGGVNKQIEAREEKRLCSDEIEKESERVMDGCIDIKWCNMDSDGQMVRKEQRIDGVWMERK